MSFSRSKLVLWGLIVVLCLAIGWNVPAALADDTTTNREFSLQVSPSPLTASIKPGETSQLTLKIRNAATQPEYLKIELRSFSVDQSSGEIKLSNDEPTEVKDFVSFQTSKFHVDAGQWYDQKITIKTPAEAGFSYSFAILISRDTETASQNGGATIKGSVAVFTLLGVDRPGAVRQFQIEKLSTDKNVYEYLPATVRLQLKNSGNTIIQPKGTIFVQRHSNDTASLASININDGGGYILPGNSRQFETSWNDGFPHFETDSGGKQHLRWNWNNLSHLRIGKYVAKVYAVYYDGQRDVPVIGEVTFWVIPWKLMLVGLVVLIVFGVGSWTIIRRATKLIKRRRRAATEHHPKP